MLDSEHSSCTSIEVFVEALQTGNSQQQSGEQHRGVTQSRGKLYEFEYRRPASDEKADRELVVGLWMATIVLFVLAVVLRDLSILKRLALVCGGVAAPILAYAPANRSPRSAYKIWRIYESGFVVETPDGLTVLKNAG